LGPDFDGGAELTLKAAANGGEGIGRGRCPVHQHLTGDEQVSRNLSERRPAALTSTIIREQPAGRLIPDSHLDRFRLMPLMPPLKMHKLMDEGARCLHRVQPVIQVDINTVRVARITRLQTFPKNLYHV